MKDRANIKKSGGLLLPELKKAALETFTPGHPGGDDHIHPSEMAKADWCPRSTYYRLLSGKAINDDTFNFTLESIFDEGHSVEKKWQDRMRQTGKLWGTWKCLVCKKLTGNQLEPAGAPCFGGVHIWEYKEVALGNDKLMIHGHEDGAMVPGGYLVECKTIGLGTVRFDAPNLVKRYYHPELQLYDTEGIWRDLKRPFTTHVRQTNVYLWLAQEMGYDFDTAVLLYEYKPNQQTKEFPVKLSAEVIEPLLTKAQSVVYALESKTPPPCEGCKYCKAYENSEGFNASPQDDNRGTALRDQRLPERGSQPVEAGDRHQPVGEAPSTRPTRRPARSHRGTRLPVDESLSGAELVGEVPRRPASGSGGRRVVRRKSSNQD